MERENDRTEEEKAESGPPGKDARIDRIKELLARKNEDISDADLRELLLIYLRRKFIG